MPSQHSPMPHHSLMSRGETIFVWTLLVLFLVILLYIELLPLLRAGGSPPPMQVFEGMTPPERGAYFGYLFSQLPGWVNVWMHFQDCIMFASILFVFWYKPVRWYLLGGILNHIFIFGLIPVVPERLLSLELAALSHFFWIPALIIFIKAWPSVDKRSPFGIWISLAIFQLCFSLAFDIPQGLAWIGKLFV